MTPGSSRLPLVDRAHQFVERVALTDDEGSHTYNDLLADSALGAARLLADSDDLSESRVAFMVDPSYRYVRTQWSIWRAGGIAVPLCVTHPAPELDYVLDTTRPIAVVASSRYAELIEPLARGRGIDFLLVDELDSQALTSQSVRIPDIDSSRRAMILFTSGTTGRPKGVVTTHDNITAQIGSLVDAWEWTPEDRILLTLPLHHIHGIVNVVGCTLWSGAHCEILPAFDASRVIERLTAGNLSLFMAVPTIYHRLISQLDKASDIERASFQEGARRLRLMVSGSAALPISTLERWQALSGHTLLERYGMTEIGMGLSNPLRGERVPGEVGRPLPGVEVRLVDDFGVPVGSPSEAGDESPGIGRSATGEIQVRGPGVFGEYWERPDATAEAFTEDGWFRTGDAAIANDRRFRILGRTSVDILKSGGEKVSALEVEEIILGHEAVMEVAVVGLDDIEWGHRIVAVVVSHAPLEAGELKEWCKARLAPHKVPKAFLFSDVIPRNALGKALKPELVNWVKAQN